MDYDVAGKSDVVRCLSLADGQEIWRFAYHIRVKENHGMSRTMPAVTDQYLVTLGPKCHVACFRPDSGQLLWSRDLVAEFGATVPEWYAGQCPLIDGDKVILATGAPGIPAPGGALLIAVDLATGNVAWKSPNPHAWKMTHASIMPMDPPGGGRRTYIYCASGGVAGIAADDGSILWDSTAWKVSLATVASPLVIGDGRVFFSGGYGSGSLMAKVVRDGDHFALQPLQRLAPNIFGAVQQTPILYQDHIYGVRPDGLLTCLDLDGKVIWTSPHSATFGLGPFLIADGLILAMTDTGELRLAEAMPEGYKELAKAQVFQDGVESWGPMALAGGRLIVRDRTRMTCLHVGEEEK
jgi:outer membrane protein assembly factor BamB